MLHRLFAFALAALLSACATLPRPAAEAPRQPVTILVSIDGFHPHYLGKGDTPVLDRLAAEGVSGAMIPAFPTKTFPNHYTLVTGLAPDRHGIVGNNMVDPRRPDEKFSLGNAKQSQDPFWWDEAEPIWVTAEKAGVRTGTMFWPGADVKIGGTFPSDWVRYYEPFSYAQRVRTVRDWLARSDPAERPRFVTLYFEDVDTQGHDHGPGSAEVRTAVRTVDGAIGGLMRDLAALRQPANLVIVSDHGMAANDPKRVTMLDSLLPRDAYTLVNYGAMVELEPVAGRAAEVERALLKPHPHLQCWRKGELPARFAYGRNRRVPAIVCLSETGWETLLDRRDDWTMPGGDHGYDPADPSMRALFVAHGLAFKRGVQLPDFANVHLYPLLARLTGVAPLPNDGDPGVLAPALAR